MKRLLFVLAALFLMAPAAVLLVFEFEPIWPNLAASYICTAPMFAATHLLMRRHVDQRHAATHARLDAQDAAQAAHAAELAAHREDLAAVAVKVSDIHDLHVSAVIPKRLIRP